MRTLQIALFFILSLCILNNSWAGDSEVKHDSKSQATSEQTEGSQDNEKSEEQPKEEDEDEHAGCGH